MPSSHRHRRRRRSRRPPSSRASSRRVGSTRRARDSIRRFDRSLVARRRLSRDVRTFDASAVLNPKPYTIVVRTRLTVCPHVSYSHPSNQRCDAIPRASTRASAEGAGRGWRRRRETLENVGKSPNGRASGRSVVLERKRARGDGEHVGCGCSRRQHPSGSRGDEGRRARGDLGAAGVEG